MSAQTDAAQAAAQAVADLAAKAIAAIHSLKAQNADLQSQVANHTDTNAADSAAAQAVADQLTATAESLKAVV